MKISLKTEHGYEVKKLLVDARVRYWEDATVNGVEDTEGTLIPCRDGEDWKPEIDIESGKILNWKEGVTADIHYKVCDAGLYTLLDENGHVVLERDGYVPDILCPADDGYGDYIIMHVDANGQIKDWKPNLIKEFASSE